MSIFKLCAFADEADASVAGQIKALHENGIELLEIRGVDGKSVTELTVAEMRELRKKLDDEGSKVWSIGSPIGKIDIKDDFESHLELFRRTLELAKEAGADKMRIFSFFVKREDALKYRAEVIDRMGRFAEVAKGSGISLCHENEKDIYGEIPEHCVDIHKAIPEISAVYDPANFVQCGVDTLAAWELLEPYISYM
ncbi:MAG: sugar phosphate isomerase/epimerase, partial [Oscillospiraceae bacterium]|nr:sugar phosphate isomerase/epimerase [Oscillospiraceae bacterium]